MPLLLRWMASQLIWTNHEDAEAKAAEVDDPTWFSKSLDTGYEYVVLGPNGKILT